MELENILSTKNLRELTLIRFLIKNGSTHPSIIIKKLNYSGATLYRDIQQLNTVINPIQILTKNNIELSFPKKFNNRQIFSALLAQSPEFNLLEEIFFNESHSLLSLSQKIFLSESSTKRLLKKINSVLKIYTISITSFPIKIVGDEKNIWNLMIRIFKEKYPNHELPFEKKEQYALQKIILKNLKKESLNLNFSDVEQLKIITLVILKRMQNGHMNEITTSNLPETYWDFLNNPLYKRIFKSILKIDLTKKNIIYLFSPFFQTKFAVDFKHLKQLKNQFPEVKKRLIDFQHLIANISEHYSIEIEDEDILIFHLYNTNEITLGFSYILYNKSKEFLDGLTEGNKEFLNYVNKQLIQLQLIDNKQAYDSYALPYILVTHWKNLALELQKNSHKMRVGLFFDSDTEHTLFIKNILDAKFKYKLDIHLIEVLKLKEINNESLNLNLIITNIPGLDIKFTESICISMYPNSVDFYNIEQFYFSYIRNLF